MKREKYKVNDKVQEIGNKLSISQIGNNAHWQIMNIMFTYEFADQIYFSLLDLYNEHKHV